MGSLVVVTGCGTGVGKTHTTEAVILRLRETVRVGSWKPIETGVPEGSVGDDTTRLARAAIFHVKQRYTFVPAISPHLAAEEANVRIEIAQLAHDAALGRDEGDVLVVELAGGLFSPITLEQTNADIVRALQPDLHVLIASDRIGVLHDVLAVMRSAPIVDAVILVADGTTDPSQATNARELRRLGVPCLGTLPRGPSRELAHHPVLTDLIAKIPRP